MIGEHAQRRQHEPAVQRADGELDALGVEQLLQPLELTFVVAQNDRGWLARDYLSQSLEITVHGLRGDDREARRRLGLAHRHPREGGLPDPPVLRVEPQHRALRNVFSQPPGHLPMVRRFVPRPHHLAVDRGLLLDHQHGIGRQQLEQRRPRQRRCRLHGRRFRRDRQHRDTLDRLLRALRIEVEAA